MSVRHPLPDTKMTPRRAKGNERLSCGITGAV